MLPGVVPLVPSSQPSTVTAAGFHPAAAGLPNEPPKKKKSNGFSKLQLDDLQQRLGITKARLSGNFFVATLTPASPSADVCVALLMQSWQSVLDIARLHSVAFDAISEVHMQDILGTVLRGTLSSLLVLYMSRHPGLAVRIMREENMSVPSRDRPEPVVGRVEFMVNATFGGTSQILVLLEVKGSAIELSPSLPQCVGELLGAYTVNQARLGPVHQHRSILPACILTNGISLYHLQLSKTANELNWLQADSVMLSSLTGSDYVRIFAGLWAFSFRVAAVIDEKVTEFVRSVSIP